MKNTRKMMAFLIGITLLTISPAYADHDRAVTTEQMPRQAQEFIARYFPGEKIAYANGLHATFMPKPIFGIAGSGMHINMSLQKDGKNIFQDASDPNGLSEEAYYFIGGIMRHIKGMAAITNPLVNSYKRLVPGFEAPVYIAWSTTNRSP